MPAPADAEAHGIPNSGRNSDVNVHAHEKSPNLSARPLSPGAKTIEQNVDGTIQEEVGSSAKAMNSDSDPDETDPNTNQDTPQSLPSTGSKKKRKPRKKKNANSGKLKQSDPPRKPVKDLLPDGFKEAQTEEYRGENCYRTTNEEKRHLDLMNHQFLAEYREAAEVHRQVRQWAQKWIKPGMSLTQIAEGIEDSVRSLTGHQGLEEGDALKAGMGFPTGLSINRCAAHYTPNAGNTTFLQQGDVMKVDFGVHVAGRIVDSAFTIAFEDRYTPLLDAVRDGTNVGIRESGIDVRLGDIGAAIQEAIECYEIELDGKTYPIKPIGNLHGHKIERYTIHGGKSVPIIKSSDQTKMEEGEVFAIETFASTGRGYVHEDMETSHYAKMASGTHIPLRLASARPLLASITKNFGTLPFCRRYLDRLGHEKYLLGLNHLVASGVVEAYPPLCDVKGSYTSQFEHTIILRPTVKEIVSRGDDY